MGLQYQRRMWQEVYLPYLRETFDDLANNPRARTLLTTMLSLLCFIGIVTFGIFFFAVILFWPLIIYTVYKFIVVPLFKGYLPYVPLYWLLYYVVVSYFAAQFTNSDSVSGILYGITPNAFVISIAAFIPFRLFYFVPKMMEDHKISKLQNHLQIDPILALVFDIKGLKDMHKYEKKHNLNPNSETNDKISFVYTSKEKLDVFFRFKELGLINQDYKIMMWRRGGRWNPKNYLVIPIIDSPKITQLDRIFIHKKVPGILKSRYNIRDRSKLNQIGLYWNTKGLPYSKFVKEVIELRNEPIIS